MLNLFLILFLSFNNIHALSKRAENPGLTVVKAILDGYHKIDTAKQDYIHAKIDYKTYQKRKDKVSKYLSSRMDFDKVVKDALKYGKGLKKDHFRGKTETQKREFILAFKKLIENITYIMAWSFFDGYKMDHSVIKNTKRLIKVKTIIHYKKRPVELLWVIHKFGKRWLVYDISIEDEFWIRSFRSQFNDMITKKSYNKLLSLMKKKLKEIKEDNRLKDEKARKKFLENNNKKEENQK